jgi:hypothetical protein
VVVVALADAAVLLLDVLADVRLRAERTVTVAGMEG